MRSHPPKQNKTKQNETRCSPWSPRRIRETGLRRRGWRVGAVFLKGRKPLSAKALRGSGWKRVSAQSITCRALWAPGSRRVTKSGAFISQAPRMSPPRTLPALLPWNGTNPIPQALASGLSDIKAPLRAKDFEKIRGAPAPYRVPAPSRASRKFRVSAASPLRSSRPKVSKDKLVTSRPAPGSRLRLKGVGKEGHEVRGLFEGRAHWLPCACRTPSR